MPAGQSLLVSSRTVQSGSSQILPATPALDKQIGDADWNSTALAKGHTISGTSRAHPACRSFADGFPNLFVKDATKIRNRHVAFLASFQHPVSIFEQLSIIYQLTRMFVGSFTLVLPYFPTGTAERVSQRFGTDLCMTFLGTCVSPKRVNRALWVHGWVSW